MVLRSSLIAAGLGVAITSILALSPLGASQARKASDIERRLALVTAPKAGTTPSLASTPLAAAPALLPVLAGEGGAVEAPLRLEGIVRRPDRIAALVSIGGAAAEWMVLGEGRAGVVLQDVSSSGVTIDTPWGRRDLALGAGAPAGLEPASAPAQAAAPAEVPVNPLGEARP